jgi:hypothetical protein
MLQLLYMSARKGDGLRAREASVLALEEFRDDLSKLMSILLGDLHPRDLWGY